MRCLYAWAVVFLSISGSSRSLAEEKASGPKPTSPEKGWTRLFDGKSFDGWYVRLGNQKTNGDPEKMFQVHDGLIHVYKDQVAGTKVPNGYLATKAEYANYHFRLEFKWGEKRFWPRVKDRRDAGMLYHVLPPDVVWPRCVECQIQENDVGDCFTVRGSRVITSAVLDNANSPKKLFRYQPETDGGKVQTFGDGGIVRVIKSSTHEKEGWNTLEVIVRGSKGSKHIVNGHTVFESKELLQLKGDKDNKKWEPLASGHIALQCEFAEVFYRNVEIKAIADGPLRPEAVR